MSRLDRRAFLRHLSIAGGALVLRPAALRVDAEATVFFAQPDGQRVLVRFFVSGADAPGGRLRVFDRARRQLGTAGVIPLGDGRLYGELWVPLVGSDRLESELVLPGRAPFRSSHVVTPAARWRLYWTTVVSPDHLRRRLADLSPLHRGAQVGLWTSAGVTVNPVPDDLGTRLVDHLPLLGLCRPAQDLEWETGLARGAVAVIPAWALGHPTLAAALYGSGVHYAASFETSEPAWWLGPDGSRLLTAPLHPGGRPTELGFAEGGAEVVRRVERWIARLPAPAGGEGAALIAGITDQDASADVLRAVSEWNSRLAFPQILLGSGAEYFRQLEQRGPIRPPIEIAPPAEAVPERASELAALAGARNQERERRAAGMTAALGGLEAVAQHVAYGLPGTLVFNPSPFTRSALTRLSDGTERVVAAVPATGYAFVPHSAEGEGRWSAPVEVPPDVAVANAHLRLVLDGRTGAIASLTSLPDQTEWARSGGVGLNAVLAARVERVRRQELPGAALRLVVERWSPGRGAVRTTITLSDDIPRLDIVNTAEAVGDSVPEYQFALPMEQAWVEWEVAAGFRRARAPVGPFSALRWVRISAPAGGALLFGSLDAPLATVSEAGDLLVPGPRGDARLSLALRPTTRYPPRDDPWHFGWSLEPFLTTTVGTRASSTLPSFGSVLRLDEPGVIVLGIEPRGGGRVVVHFQELLGVRHTFPLRPGVLRFEEARQADLLGVAGEPLPRGADGGVTVTLPANGVAAVSLHEVSLQRA